MTKLVATTLTIALSACAAEKVGTIDQEVLSGTSPGEDVYASVGALRTNLPSICTGTLIGPRAVLTAAHCVDPESMKAHARAVGMDPDDLEYSFGFERDALAATDADFYAVSDTLMHPDYTPGRDNDGEGWHDIAIAYLAEPVEGRPFQTLALGAAAEALSPGDMMAVAGYGMSDQASAESYGILLEGLSPLNEVGAGELFAGKDASQSTCKGDSGGPLFTNESDLVQVGVTSHMASRQGENENQTSIACSYGMYYTRVDVHADWILANMDGPFEDGGCSVGTSQSNASSILLLLGLFVWGRRRRASPRSAS